MTDQTPKLALPYIQAAQAQKHVTHNEAIELLDMIVQLTVEDFGVNNVPGTATEGQAWTIGNVPTGTWAGHANTIATYRGNGWLFVAPNDGWLAWGRNNGELRAFTNGAWVIQNGEPDLQNLPGIGINASADNTNRLTVASDATLLNNAGAGHQVKINKASAGDTASLLYQSGFSGRAEMGLAGNEDFSIKVSEGGAWTNAINIEAATGTFSVTQLLNLKPRTAPGGPAAGDIYFDEVLEKLRCFDGTIWHELF